MKYPNIRVELVEEDRNAFGILARVRRALREAGVSEEEADQYWEQATAGTYDDLLRVTMEWVDVT